MNILQPDNDNRYSDKQIHISDLAYTSCNRLLYFKYSGVFSEIFNQTTLWHFAVGKAIHRITQDNFVIACKNTVNVEQRVSYKSVVGSVDMIEISKKFVDIIDIKSTNSFCFEKDPTEVMNKQVAIYSGIIGTTNVVKMPKGAKIRGWIWKVNKGGLPRYFDYDLDRYPVNLDIYKELDNAVDRADIILKCVKSKTMPEGDKKQCSKCPARAVCIVKENEEKEKKLYGGKK